MQLTNMILHMIRVPFEFSNLESSMFIFINFIHRGTVDFCHFSNNCLSFLGIQGPFATLRNSKCKSSLGSPPLPTDHRILHLENLSFHLRIAQTWHGLANPVYKPIRILDILLLALSTVNLLLPILANLLPLDQKRNKFSMLFH